MKILAELCSELVEGATDDGNAFVLNSGDVGLLRSLDALPADEASMRVNGGASIAAHATHLAYGLSLMNRWMREGGNPFADARWDEAWKISDVSNQEWARIRVDLRTETEGWLNELRSSRELGSPELKGMMASIAHLAYHLGAIRQISRSARGPKEGVFG